LPTSRPILPAPEAFRRLAVPALLTGSDADDVSVDRARDAVVHLGVQLGKDVSVMDARLLDVPDGRLLHDVPHLEPLDGLVLGAALGAVGAADVLDMAAAVLVAAAVAALEGHTTWNGQANYVTPQAQAWRTHQTSSPP